MNRNNTSLKLFELSRIYLQAGPGDTKELTELCIGIAGKKSDNWLQKAGRYSFFDLKGIAETLLNKLGLKDFRFSAETASALSACFIPGRWAGLFLGAECYGILGEIKKEILERFDIACAVYVCNLQLHRLVGRICPEKRFVPLARFPAIERDISLVAPVEVEAERIVTLIRRIGRDLIAKVTLFDQYFGEQIPQGSRGLSFSIEYRSFERTLTNEEVDKLHGQIRQALINEFKVQIR